MLGDNAKVTSEIEDFFLIVVKLMERKHHKAVLFENRNYVLTIENIHQL